MKNNIQKNKNHRLKTSAKGRSSHGRKKGTTLVELLVYMAIVSTVVTSLVLFGWNIIKNGEKATRQEEVISSASLLSEKIKFEIRNANGINSVTANSLSLSETNPALNPTVIDLLNERVQIKLGSSAPIEITPTNVRVTNLIFYNYSSANATNIGFTFTIVNNNPSPGNIFEQSTITSTVDLRSK